MDRFDNKKKKMNNSPNSLITVITSKMYMNMCNLSFTQFVLEAQYHHLYRMKFARVLLRRWPS